MFCSKARIEKLPLVDEEGRLTGLITAQDIEKRDMYLNSAKDRHGRLRVGAAIGVGPDCFDRAAGVIEAGADAVFIDAATGHTERVLSVIEKINSDHGKPVVAGNVVTADGAKDLIAAGAAAVKVGVGPGSICTTRVIAGVGTPQFTAIQNVAPVCHEKGIPLIADGGIRYSGDVVKAMAAGANLVMLGSPSGRMSREPRRNGQSQGASLERVSRYGLGKGDAKRIRGSLRAEFVWKTSRRRCRSTRSLPRATCGYRFSASRWTSQRYGLRRRGESSVFA